MTENLDVKLVESIVHYTPEPEYKQNSWLGDYETAYREFLADPDASGTGLQKTWTGCAVGYCEGMELSLCEMVCERKTQHNANCLDRHVKNHRRNKVALI